MIEAFYACVCTLGDDCYILNLTRAIAPWAFDRVEEHLVANSFDFSPTTESVFKQRLRLFAANPLIRPIVLGLDDFVYLEPDGAPQEPPAGRGRRVGADGDAPPPFVKDPQEKMWPIRIRLMDLTMGDKLAPLGDLAALLGRRLSRDDRLRTGAQFQMAVAILKEWSKSYGVDDPPRLPC